MKKFLVLYRSELTASEQMAQATPAQQAEGMQAWMKWATQAGDAVVDLGAPLAPASQGADGKIGGFSILQAETPDALQQVLAGHPHTAMGGTIETYEFLPTPGS